jgi:hypothetical protein
MKTSALKTTVLFGLIATLSTACGNYVGGNRGIRVSTSGVNYGTTADLTALSGGGTSTYGTYTCPNSPNVLPSNTDNLGSNAGKYTVCTDSQSTANIMLHGNTNGSSTICVFPLQYIDSTHTYFKPDTSTGLPLSTCSSVTSATSSNGVTMGFAGMSFNAVIIVDDTDQAAMQLCLANASPGGCPNYSYGKFRN